MFVNRNGVEVHKHAKKRRGQYPAAVLTEQAWSIKEKEHYFLVGIQLELSRVGFYSAADVVPSQITMEIKTAFLAEKAFGLGIGKLCLTSRLRVFGSQRADVDLLFTIKILQTRKI